MVLNLSLGQLPWLFLFGSTRQTPLHGVEIRSYMLLLLDIFIYFFPFGWLCFLLKKVCMCLQMCFICKWMHAYINTNTFRVLRISLTSVFFYKTNGFFSRFSTELLSCLQTFSCAGPKGWRQGLLTVNTTPPQKRRETGHPSGFYTDKRLKPGRWICVTMKHPCKYQGRTFQWHYLHSHLSKEAQQTQWLSRENFGETELGFVCRAWWRGNRHHLVSLSPGRKFLQQVVNLSVNAIMFLQWEK